ncbi:APC family permease [Sphingobacterium corticibacter]|uniref:Amino acid transporter n=1 Tax=Sphingobacterium corticibacter TaxID=2171749 RepID=A0A2T8HLJ8_9SPHI|nr:amino acid permease [Sphingobacterium corticibacter]PVH26324.1 amino acid transporter [Sphingobacterium corticibacter]
MQESSLKKEIRLIDAISIVVGSMVGSGIFIVGADIVRQIGSAGGFIGVWVLGGVITLIAALSYGELGAMFPKAGGQYVYLKEAYNPLVAFLYGWSLFAVIQTGTMAAVGVSFFKFLAYFLPQFGENMVLFGLSNFTISAAQLAAVCLIFILTYVNTKGIKSGKTIQTLFTITKVLSIGGLIVFGFISFESSLWEMNWSSIWQFQKILPDGEIELYQSLPDLGGGIAAALVGAIMSYEAWNNVTFVAGEIQNPKKNIVLSLLIGVSIVTLIYVLLNLMFTAVLPLSGIAYADKDRVAIAVSQNVFGELGTGIIAILIMVATFGCNNGLIISGARVYYTMAQDQLFFKSSAQLNKYAVPSYALWYQAIMASLLCLSGGYGDLLDMITFVAVLFYVITIVGIYVLRVRRPNLPRPYRTIGYPILPSLYILMGLAFCILLIIYKPDFTWPGLLIALAGIPIYFLLQHKYKRR